jgi:hypothetical protein
LFLYGVVVGSGGAQAKALEDCAVHSFSVNPTSHSPLLRFPCPTSCTEWMILILRSSKPKDSHRSRRSPNLRLTDLRGSLGGLRLLDSHRHHHPHSSSQAPSKFSAVLFSVLSAFRCSDLLSFVNRLEALLFGLEHGITRDSDNHVIATNHRHSFTVICA